MSEIRSDITIVGGGIAGLWSAKEFLEHGYSVNLIEKAGTLACGATTRNEGWLHAGTYHSVAIYDQENAQKVTERTKYGHAAIREFAPQAVEHETTYAITATPEMTQQALSRWNENNIPHTFVPVERLQEQGVDMSRVDSSFKVEDVSVNSRKLCSMLISDILLKGGNIFTDATFAPISETKATLIYDGFKTTINSDRFVISAGTGTKQIFEELLGKEFPMRFFKSHLLVSPRLTQDNIFYMDPLEAGVMNHGEMSIIGINREATEVITPDYEIIAEKDQLVRGALARLLPHVHSIEPNSILSVACIKADINTAPDLSQDPNILLQDLNINVHEPVPGYICAIPGKMTEGPVLAKAVVAHTAVTIDRKVKNYEVTPRPADEWSRLLSRG